VSRPLLALACSQREDIAATIANAPSSSPTNKGVHHREESHVVCHSREPLASSGTRNVVGITPPRWRRPAATRANLHKGGGEGGAGKLSLQKQSISPAWDIIASKEAESVVPRRFVHLPPRCPLPPSRLAAAAPTKAQGRLPAGNEAID